MKTKLKTLCAAAVISCAVSFLLPAGPVSAAEPCSSPAGYARAAESSIAPLSDNLIWIYKSENGKRYKRLYNTSTRSWIGGWIYVCDEP